MDTDPKESPLIESNKDKDGKTTGTSAGNRVLLGSVTIYSKKRHYSAFYI